MSSKDLHAQGMGGLVPFNFRLPKRLLAKLDAWVALLNEGRKIGKINRSELIREMIEKDVKSRPPLAFLGDPKKPVAVLRDLENRVISSGFLPIPMAKYLKFPNKKDPDGFISYSLSDTDPQAREGAPYFPSLGGMLACAYYIILPEEDSQYFQKTSLELAISRAKSIHLPSKSILSGGRWVPDSMDDPGDFWWFSRMFQGKNPFVGSADRISYHEPDGESHKNSGPKFGANASANSGATSREEEPDTSAQFAFLLPESLLVELDAWIEEMNQGRILGKVTRADVIRAQMERYVVIRPELNSPSSKEESPVMILCDTSGRVLDSETRVPETLPKVYRFPTGYLGILVHAEFLVENQSQDEYFEAAYTDFIEGKIDRETLFYRVPQIGKARKLAMHIGIDVDLFDKTIELFLMSGEKGKDCFWWFCQIAEGSHSDEPVKDEK